jgi:hypothetical protein
MRAALRHLVAVWRYLDLWIGTDLKREIDDRRELFPLDAGKRGLGDAMMIAAITDIVRTNRSKRLVRTAIGALVCRLADPMGDEVTAPLDRTAATNLGAQHG